MAVGCLQALKLLKQVVGAYLQQCTAATDIHINFFLIMAASNREHFIKAPHAGAVLSNLGRSILLCKKKVGCSFMLCGAIKMVG